MNEAQSMVEFNNVLTQCITIPIRTDTEKESDETFNLVIQPSGSYKVGSIGTITVTIEDGKMIIMSITLLYT